MIDPRLAVIFEVRLAWTQEIDKEMKLALWRKFEEELEKFCQQEDIQISPGDFLHFTRDAFREWRRAQPGR